MITRSYCNDCYAVVPAESYVREGHVFLSKICPRHGVSVALLEKDVSFYKQFSLRDEGYSPFHTLALPVTFRCNLTCPHCWSLCSTGRRDMFIDEIMGAIDMFSGEWVALSGGEPLVLENLPEIIRCIRQRGKHCSLLTNGTIAVDLACANELRAAGLEYVMVSLDSLNDDFYAFLGVPSAKVVARKIQSVQNLRSAGIELIMSSTLFRGRNDGEIKDLYLFAREYSRSFRLRSVVDHQHDILSKEYFLRQGENQCPAVVVELPYDGEYFTSELKDLFQRQVGQRLETLANRAGHNTLWQVEFDVEGMHVMLNHWRSVHAFDLAQARHPGVAHFYNNTILDFCSACIFMERDKIAGVKRSDSV